MGRKHSKEQILAGAIAVAREHGLSQLTFGRVAAQLGISDRTVVYYLPTKDDLVGEVVTSLGVELQQTLGAAFTVTVADHVDLVRRAWPVLAADDTDATFALFFEAIGLAAAGREPYRSLIPELLNGWIAWAATFIEGGDDVRLAEASAAVATIDGLLLLRQIAGPEVAETAGRRLGIAQ